MTRLAAIILTIIVLAAACSGDSVDPAADVEVAADTPQAEATAESTAEPRPTAEPEPTSAPATEPDAGRDFSSVAAAIDGFVTEQGLNGAGIIVVHRDDGVLYHDHFGEFDEDRVSLIASSSKMISAGVLLKLQEQGLLDIDAPIADVVEWGAAHPDITAAQLISNSSGLVGLGPDLLYAPYLCQWASNLELEQCGEFVFTTEGDDADVIPPDTEFRYGGAQWQVAGAIAETASGKPWAQLIEEIYVEPCGVDSLGYISLGSVATGGFGYPATFRGETDRIESSENPSIEGGAYITTGDYGELLLMHLRAGRCADTQVLSQTSLDTMHGDRIAEAYDGDAFGADTGYGMGWWVDRETGVISDGGAFGTVPWLDLDDGYGVYLVIEDTSGTGQELAAEIEDLVHDIVVGTP